MPTKRFTNLQQIGPMVADIDGNGDVIFPSSSGGAATTPTTAIVMTVLDVDGTTSQTLADDGGISPENLALATRARITSLREPAYFTYLAGNPPNNGYGHVIPTNETVIIDGNANINALEFLGTSATTAGIVITLEA